VARGEMILHYPLTRVNCTSYDAFLLVIPLYIIKFINGK
jgi:hypothetical protein